MDPGGLLAVLHPSACRHISRISASIFTWVLFACTSVSKFSSLFFFFSWLFWVFTVAQGLFSSFLA